MYGDNGEIVVYLAENIGKDSAKCLDSCLEDYIKRKKISLPEPIRIIRSEQQKPKTNFSEVQFSVSHSGDLWACGVSSRPLGIDLELHRNIYMAERISRRFFHPAEYEYLKQYGFAEAPFFSVWTAKESYVKYTGEGISEHYSSFSAVEDLKLSGKINGIPYRYFPVKEGYSFCVSSKVMGPITFVYLK